VRKHNHLLRLLPITVALLIMMPAVSHAQVTRAPFVEGSVLLESDFAGGGGQGRSLTAGGGAEVGIHLTDRDSLRFGAEIPGWHTGEDLAGLVHSRTTSYSLLIARRFRSTRRVQVEALVGLSLMTSSERRPVRNVGWEWLPSEQTDRWLDPNIGLAVPISLTRRLTIVPQVRMHTGLLVVLDPEGPAHDLTRLSVGMRWQF
jgi:hypothetical protein